MLRSLLVGRLGALISVLGLVFCGLAQAQTTIEGLTRIGDFWCEPPPVQDLWDRGEGADRASERGRDRGTGLAPGWLPPGQGGSPPGEGGDPGKAANPNHDLVAEGLFWFPAHPLPGDVVFVYGLFRNQGTAPIGKDFTVRLTGGRWGLGQPWNSPPVDLRVKDRIEPARTVGVRFLLPQPPEAGLHNLRLLVDVFDDVKEAHEFNNHAARCLWVSTGDATGVRTVTTDMNREGLLEAMDVAGVLGVLAEFELDVRATADPELLTIGTSQSAISPGHTEDFPQRLNELLYDALLEGPSPQPPDVSVAFLGVPDPGDILVATLSMSVPGCLLDLTLSDRIEMVFVNDAGLGSDQVDRIVWGTTADELQADFRIVGEAVGEIIIE